MSLVIKNAKKKYKSSLLFESIFFIITFVVYILSQNSFIFSFFMGGISIFLPHCLFVLSIFFTKQVTKNQLKKLYLGEFIKFIFTIFLIIVIFKFFSVSFIAFFVGYFVSILLNNFLPFLVNKYLSI